MKLVTNLLAVGCLTMSAVSWAQKGDTQAELGKLADSGTTVTVKGTLEVWKDGSAAFDNADPISIFK